MKKLLLLGVIYSIILNFNIQVIPLTKANNIETKKIELISNYIISLQEEVESFKNKYNINDNEILEEEINNINDLFNILNNLNKNNSGNYDNETIISLVLEKLKNSKDIIKNIIKQKKVEYEKDFSNKREFYLKISKQLNSQINHLIINVYDAFKNKETLSEKEIEIIKILKELNNENVKLKNFGNTNFNSTQEMTENFVKILKNTKKEMLKLKQVGKK